MALFPKVIDSYAGPRDEAMDDDIHMRDRTDVYGTDNKIFFRELSHIFSRSALWVHAKCDVKTCDGRVVYKLINNHLFGSNSLGNRDAACETTIGKL